MTLHILIAVACPPVDADLDVAQIAATCLPADILARYHRLAGHRVLMVSGSDAYSMAVALAADQLQTTPRTVYEHYHARHLRLLQALGIGFDLYTTTRTENHHRIARDVFQTLLDHGCLFEGIEEQWYSPARRRVLSDAYVEGTCAHCHNPRALGDRCALCGNWLDAAALIDAYAVLDGEALELAATEEHCLDLEDLAPALRQYLQHAEGWRPAVLQAARLMAAGGQLRARAITRETHWGIPAPLKGRVIKRLYSALEAPIGLLSASVEWAARRWRRTNAWKEWWYDPEAQSYYLIGKSDVPFYALLWPAVLIGVGRLYEDDPQKRLALPGVLVANERLLMEGGPVYAPDVLQSVAPDALRYYLAATLPETIDADWSVDELVRRNNHELLATWGNLAHRVLTFAVRHYDGCVPDPGELRAEDKELLAEMEAGLAAVGGLIAEVRLRAALHRAMGLATEVNRYLNRREPWFEIADRPADAARTIFTALRAIDTLKVLLAPFVPFTSEKLHAMLGYGAPLMGRARILRAVEAESAHEVLVYDGQGVTGRWAPSELPAGQALGQVGMLVDKIEHARV